MIVRDSKEMRVARFTDLSKQENGILSEKFEIKDDVNLGEWTMSVKISTLR